MDLKTLEYMEERAKKARTIVDRIDTLTKRIRFLAIGGNEINIGTWDYDPIKDQFQAELVATTVKVFIDLCLAEIRQLEAELAEL